MYPFCHLSCYIIDTIWERGLYFMKRKFIITSLGILFLIMIPLSARSLFDVGLKVVTLYDVQKGVERDGFFSGMREGSNWSFGFGVDGRISILHASVIATSVFGSENLMNLYYCASVDIPIVNDMVYLSLGGGLSNQLELPVEEDDEMRFTSRSAGDSFLDVMQDSPIHLSASVDLLLGPAMFSLFYMVETSSKMGDPISNLFTSDGVHKGGVSLTLMLF